MKLKICSTCVKITSTSCELHTAQEATNSTIMRLLYINIAHVYKTLTKSQSQYWSSNRTTYTLRGIVSLWEQCLTYTCTMSSSVAMIRLKLEMALYTLTKQATLSIVSALLAVTRSAIFNSCWAVARAFERWPRSSIASSRIVSLYKRIASRATCSSLRIYATLKLSLLKVLARYSFQDGWAGRRSLYVLNIIVFYSRTLLCSVISIISDDLSTIDETSVDAEEEYRVKTALKIDTAF